MANKLVFNPAKLTSTNFYLVLVLFITIVVYWPGLSGPLLLDDIPNLHHLKVFGEGGLSVKEVLSHSPHGLSRPVSILSFIANWITSGDNIWFLKFTNLIIHLLCGLLIFRLSCLLLGYDIIERKSSAQNIALWITALWLLSPFLVSTVLYVIQRMAQLSALFTLCGLLSYVTGRINLARNRSPGPGLIVISFVFFWPMATFSKQNGILLPLLILIIEFFFLYKNTDQIEIRRLRTTLLSLVTICGFIASAWFIYNLESLLASYDGRSFTLYQRLITQPRVLLDYAGNLFLIPGTSAMSLFHDDFKISIDLLNPVTTLPSLLICVALVFSAFFNMGKKAGALLAGLMFFFAAHLVESSFIPLELYFEHRNYLPAFGLYFSVVSVIAIVIAKLKFKNMAIIILLIAPLTFSVFTYQRAMIWQKMTRIFFYSEIIHPQSARVNEGIAFLYLLINDSNNALRHLDKVTQIEPGQRKPEFYFKYLLAYCQANKTLTEHDYKHKIKIHSLSNDLVTVNYFQLFIETVESGKCSSLDLNRLADDFKVAVSKRTAKYEVGNTSQVNMLMARLFSFLGREEEARRQSELSKIENK